MTMRMPQLLPAALGLVAFAGLLASAQTMTPAYLPSDAATQPSYTATTDGGNGFACTAPGCAMAADRGVFNASVNVDGGLVVRGTADLGTVTSGALMVVGALVVDGGTVFGSPPSGITSRACSTVASPVNLAVLNQATPITTIPGAFFKTSRPCFVVPPPSINANLTLTCRVAVDGTAIIEGKSGLLGLAASAGQWCAEVTGQ